MRFRLTNIRSKNKNFNWTFLVGYIFLSIFSFLLLYKKIDSIFSLALLLIVDFVISKILFNLPPEDSYLVFMSWWRNSLMGSEPSKRKLSIKEIKNIQNLVEKTKRKKGSK